MIVHFKQDVSRAPRGARELKLAALLESCLTMSRAPRGARELKHDVIGRAVHVVGCRAPRGARELKLTTTSAE